MPDIWKEEKIQVYSRKRNLWGRGGRQHLILGMGTVDAKNARCGMPEEG